MQIKYFLNQLRSFRHKMYIFFQYELIREQNVIPTYMRQSTRYIDKNRILTI